MTYTLNGDYGYQEYWLRDAPDTVIDGKEADWRIAADEKVPAINIYDSDNVIFDGGEIWGEVSQTAEWASIYNHYATGFRVSDSDNVTIRNFHIDGTWDGIRFIPDSTLKVANGSSNGWLVEDVWMSNIRDDAIENDFAQTGTLRDSLLDGVFSAFGTVNDQSAHGVLTVDDSIIVMKDYLKDGVMVHGSPFKFNTEHPENNPDLQIFNSIIAVQDPFHNGKARLAEAWDNLTESSGNYYLNLSDTPFPANYPLPPEGFTILQGQEARDFLAAEKTKWLVEHGYEEAPGEPESVPEPAPDPVNIIMGTSDSDDLVGTAGIDHIFGDDGADFISGGGGADQLTGGAGRDKFVFDSPLDGTITEIVDFNPLEDVFYLDNAVFAKLGSGSLSSPRRIWGTNLEDGVGACPNDSNDFLIYDKATGYLSYDADGNGAGAAVTFAHLEPGLDLAPANFYVI